jgi:crossover junction endodeoxyribonuclease RuvC
MGLDPGSRVAGFAVLRAKTAAPRSARDFVVVDAGVLKVKATLGVPERLGLLHEALYGLLTSTVNGAPGPSAPDVCVIERPFYDKNVATALTLGEVRGSFIAACARARVQVAELTPAEVKLAVAGNGRADKEAVSRALAALLGFDRGSLPLDATDALAIGLCWGLRLLGASALQAAQSTQTAKTTARRSSTATKEARS